VNTYSVLKDLARHRGASWEAWLRQRALLWAVTNCRLPKAGFPMPERHRFANAHCKSALLQNQTRIPPFVRHHNQELVQCRARLLRPSRAYQNKGHQGPLESPVAAALGGGPGLYGRGTNRRSHLFQRFSAGVMAVAQSAQRLRLHAHGPPSAGAAWLGALAAEYR